jgi:hypothetical protein
MAGNMKKMDDKLSDIRKRQQKSRYDNSIWMMMTMKMGWQRVNISRAVPTGEHVKRTARGTTNA